LYSILTNFGISMNLVKLIKMCLSEDYNRVRIGKNLSDIIYYWEWLKQGNTSSPLLLKFVIEYTSKRA